MNHEKRSADRRTRPDPCRGLDRLRTGRLGLTLLAVLATATLDGQIASIVPMLPHEVLGFGAWLSSVTDPLVVLPAVLALFLAGKRLPGLRRSAVLPALAEGLKRSCLAVAAAMLMKLVIGRARPSDHLSDPFLFHPFSVQDMFASTPSAQAALAAAIGCCLVTTYLKARIPILAAALSICLSRILAGEHWTSDVIIGWALGWSIAKAPACRAGSSRLSDRQM